MQQKESITHIISNTTPLCIIPNGKILCYRKGMLLVLHEDKEIQRLTIPISVKERLFGRFRVLTRLFRLGFRASIALDDNRVLLSRGNMLQEIDLKNGSISNGWYCGEGIRPLIFTEVKDIDGFEDGIYFGGYLNNSKKSPVNIYRRRGEDDWEVIFTFSQGEINHVHNVVADPYRNCLWMFTGDFGESAAIWKATNGFKKVERFQYGDQKWRGCVAFAIPEGLLYATDTPFSDNHIYMLKEDGIVEIVCDICGSCIYGCLWKDKYVFSSTVEADGRDESLKKLLFSKKRGSGIEDDYLRLYVGDLANGFKVVYKEKKDWLPLIFQFGAFKFPAGVNNSDTLYFQPVATKENDLDLMTFSLQST